MYIAGTIIAKRRKEAALFEEKSSFRIGNRRPSMAKSGGGEKLEGIGEAS
jgi:hypothetical protein